MAPLSARERAFLLLVAAAALAVRLACLLESRSSPFFDAPVVDAKTFYDHARRIAGGDWLGGPEPFWQPPLYTYFLALHYLLFPEAFFVAVRLTQVLLGTASCLLTYILARRVAGPTTALMAGGLAALYGPLIYYDVELLAVPVEVFLDLVLLWAVCRAMERPAPGRWAEVGAVAGLAALTRPNVLLFAAALAVWLGWRGRAGRGVAPGGARLHLGLVAALALVAAVLPVTLRNQVVGGDLVLISHNGGVNFYIGNNARYDSTVAIHPGRQWEMLVTEPVRAGFTRPSQRSGYFFRKGLRYVADSPAGWLGLLCRKTFAFWSGPEVKRNQDPYYARQHSRVLRWLLWDRWVSFPFGLIGPLSLLGLAITWRQRAPGLEVLRLFVLAYGASVVLFFPAARYRAPAVPVLLVFAACALADLGRAWRQRRHGLVLRGTGLAALTAVLNAPAGPPLARDAQLQHDLGEVYLRKGDLEGAVAHSLRALELEPDYDSALHNLALAHLRAGEPARAASEARLALQVHPRRADTRVVLAQALIALGQQQEAEGELCEALRLDPQDGGAHYQHGRLLLAEGRYAEAVEPLRRAAAGEEPHYWMLYDLGRALQGTGDLEEALRWYTGAEQLDPSRPEAAVAMGAVSLQQGRTEAARSHLHRALERDPGNPLALFNLSWAELGEGRPEEAIALLRQALPRSGDRRPVLRALVEAYRAAGQQGRAQAVLDTLESLPPPGPIGPPADSNR
ncbi:MAG: tetratricopeptide repeat protein [Candidatus Latescibacterota bacterium]